jgi:hypothetical protein
MEWLYTNCLKCAVWPSPGPNGQNFLSGRNLGTYYGSGLLANLHAHKASSWKYLEVDCGPVGCNNHADRMV